MKINLLVILLISQFVSCISQKKYAEINSKEACVILWRNTLNTWDGSYKDVVELIEKGAVVDFIHPYETKKTTPFLNASGIIERLEKQRHYTSEEIEAYELEAVKIVKYLAKKGANIHAVNVSHQNALHLAALGGREKVIPILIELGLDVNARDSTSYTFTPLILAITTGDLQTVKVLVKAGADINKCSATGNTPLDWATGYASGNNYSYPYKDQEAILEYLLSIGAKHGKNNLSDLITF